MISTYKETGMQVKGENYREELQDVRDFSANV